jgi:hypothetical protein
MAKYLASVKLSEGSYFDVAIEATKAVAGRFESVGFLEHQR